MNQLQFNGKTSTKRPNPSAASNGAGSQKKTIRLVSRAPRSILPKPVLTQSQQNTLPQPQQQQQSALSKLPHPQQQQQQSQLQQKQQQFISPQYDPQLYALSPTLNELDENCDETDLLVSFVMYGIF
jgi:hypothetical protein